MSIFKYVNIRNTKFFSLTTFRAKWYCSPVVSLSPVVIAEPMVVIIPSLIVLKLSLVATVVNRVLCDSVKRKRGINILWHTGS